MRGRHPLGRAAGVLRPGLLAAGLLGPALLVGAGCSMEGRAANTQAAGPESRPPATPRRVAVTDGLLAFEYGDVTPDGGAVLLTAVENGQLALFDLDTGEMRWLTDPGTDWQPTYTMYAVFSPSGRRAAYHQFDTRTGEWTLHVVDVETGESTALPPPPGGDYFEPLDWHPGGGYLLVVVEEGAAYHLAELDLESESWTRLVSQVAGAAGYGPDGRWLVFGRPAEPGSERRTRLLRRDLSREIPFEGVPPGAVVRGFSPRGDHVLYTVDSQGAPALFRKAFRGTRAVGEPALVQGERWRMYDIGLDANGRLFYATDTRRDAVWTGRLDGSGRLLSAPTIRESSLHAERPRLSPDGSTLAYFRNPHDVPAGRRLTLESLESGSAVSPAFDVPLTYPAWLRWMPDGRSLILQVLDDLGRWALYRYRLATASVDTLRIWNGEGDLGRMDPTPDGAAILFTIQTPGDGDPPSWPWELRRLDLETGQERVLVRHSERIDRPAVSPSGDSVAFVVGDRIALVGIDGGESRVVFRHPRVMYRRELAWDPRGDALYFRHRDERENPYRVVRLHVATGEISDVGFGREEVHIEAVDVSPDGRRILIGGTVLADEEIWVLEGVFPEQDEEEGPGAEGR